MLRPASHHIGGDTGIELIVAGRNNVSKPIFFIHTDSISMAKQSSNEDRNFDDLAERFQKNIYGGLKGKIRLAVLQRDCAEYLPIQPFRPAEATQWRILDAGGGQGQFSLELAKAGHQLVICDISSEMLKMAEVEIKKEGLESQVTLIHCSIQDLSKHIQQPEFDLVICHAVMEWMQNPIELLPDLNRYLKADGFLSLIFYNLNSLIYKNCLRTNFKKIMNQDYVGSAGSLTPINPLKPEAVLNWVKELPLELLCHSGIRVFHDYIFNEAHREAKPDELVALELELSRQEPFRSLGRYIHLLMCSNNKSRA
jgi:S-adenosylmethionine-dependent methyltransferase